MTDWLTHFFLSFADQAGTWFIGVVLALFGVFSGRLVETIKFALNRADLRTKYFEKLALDISHFVFITDRIVKVSYGSSWLDAEGQNAIGEEYNEVMNAISRKEYVYLSWLVRYWGKDKAAAFTSMMEKIREVDAALIHLNEIQVKDKNLLSDKMNIDELNKAFLELKTAAHSLLATIQ